MRDLLYKELLDSGLVPLSNVSPSTESMVLYIRNRTVNNVRGVIVTPDLDEVADISRPKDPETGTPLILPNQNPSLKIYERNQLLNTNQAAFCLSKGLLVSEAEFFELDEVAYETALNYVTNANHHLSYNDYTLNIENNTASFEFVDGVIGYKYVIVGLRGLNYQLSDLNNRTDNSSVLFKHNTSTYWTMQQIKNLLVYQDNGEAVLPIFIKWDITLDGSEIVPAIGNEISNGLRLAVASNNLMYEFDWDGYNRDITYKEGSATLSILDNNAIGITASYDSFYQEITVNGPAGLSVKTTDPNGVTMGSGTIDVNGTVTYPIEEADWLTDTVISTLGENTPTNTVNHNLVCSFIFEGKGLENYPNFGLFGNYYSDWSTENLPDTLQGEIIVEAAGYDRYVFNLANLDWTNDFNRWFDALGYHNGPWRDMSNPDRNDILFKMRFRNLNNHLYIDLYNANYIHKFFDDKVSNIGYCISPKTYSSDQYPLMKLPSYLPKCLTNMNFMLLNDEPYPLVSDQSVIDTLAGWDTGHVLTSDGTFWGSTYDGPLPINTLDWSKLTSAEYMFFENALLNQPINMDLPELISAVDMFAGCYELDSPVTITNSFKLETVEEMFYRSGKLNSVITIETSNVTNFSSMLRAAAKFNKSIDNLNTSNGTNFMRMMAGCNDFNQPVNIDTSKGENLSYMFDNCWLLNSPLNIDTGAASNMAYMLRSTTVFNQPLDHFKTAQLTSASALQYFLADNKAFNQDLTMWKVGGIASAPVRFQPHILNPNDLMDPWNEPLWGYDPTDGQIDIRYTIDDIEHTRVAARSDGYILESRFYDIVCDDFWFEDRIVGLRARVFQNATINNLIFPSRQFDYGQRVDMTINVDALRLINTSILTIPEGQTHLPSISAIEDGDTINVISEANDSITKIILPSTLQHLNVWFFGAISNYSGDQYPNCVEVICMAPVPPTLYGKNANFTNIAGWFDNVNFTLKVPTASVAAYRNTLTGWAYDNDTRVVGI